ncbi:hypothetical protein TrRE_jg11246 [Triparma retinervis]|uniref:Uncharacterized protein n=1 Tax=Triparma retinervis TaxID=2557542 RepID=A0A9W7A7X5_9STRA|nr:hypothetical protein TrRE_jg11246 [Triparma retinervis]
MEISGLSMSGSAIGRAQPKSSFQRRPSGQNRGGVRGAKPTSLPKYRLQCAGWRSIDEYRSSYDDPARWPSNGFLKCLRVKSNGYFTYWREWRECEDKYLNRVKLFTYAAEAKS